MKRSFQRKIFLIMLLMMTFLGAIATVLHFSTISKSVEAEKEHNINIIETTVIDTLTTMDKIYAHYEMEMVEAFELNSEKMLEKYREDPTFQSWDFTEIAEDFEMQLFVLNDENVVIHSSLAADVGLDFNQCCPKFGSLLDARRESGEFYIDSLDVSQKTGDTMRYSYHATPDGDHLLELGIELDESEFYQAFNLVDTIENLKKQTPDIVDLHVINGTGYAYGVPADEWELTGERRAAFNKVVETGERVSVSKELNGQPVEYYYTLFDAEFDEQHQVIEIVYTNNHFQSTFRENIETLIIQLIFVFIISIIVTYLISRWTEQPLYFAFNDDLTGLRNRVSFDDHLVEKLKHKSDFALLMFDLDNFKLVNDRLGHDQGDLFLKTVSESIRKSVAERGEGRVYRLGGDEFAILLTYKEKAEVEQFAQELIEKSNFPFYEHGAEIFRVTLSLGIAFNTKDDLDADTMYKQADIALYAAKEAGKNRYDVFERRA